MSGPQVLGASYHIELGWITGQSASRIESIKEMVHQDTDEIILNLGTDPPNPEDLGAEMQFDLGGQLLTYNTTSAIFVPRGVKHRPLRYTEFRKPPVFIAIMCGTGTQGKPHAKCIDRSEART